MNGDEVTREDSEAPGRERKKEKKKDLLARGTWIARNPVIHCGVSTQSHSIELLFLVCAIDFKRQTDCPYSAPEEKER